MCLTYRRTDSLLHEHPDPQGLRVVLVHRRLQRFERLHRGSGTSQHQQRALLAVRLEAGRRRHRRLVVANQRKDPRQSQLFRTFSFHKKEFTAGVVLDLT